jgi:hypothetical protein
MSRILVTAAVAALAAGFVFGSPDVAEGRDMPAVQAISGGEVGSSWRFTVESSPGKGITEVSWQPPYKSGRAPDLDHKQVRRAFVVRVAVRPWWEWWTARLPR